MCKEIFDHVFEEKLKAESGHDFSEEQRTLNNQLTHLLYHLKDNSKNITGVLFCESGDIFMRYFKEYLYTMFSVYVDMHSEIPRDFVLNYYVGSFSETIIWWFQEKMKYSPEQVCDYYMTLNNINPTL